MEIETEEEQDDITEMMSSVARSKRSFWMGLTDLTEEGTWVWDVSNRQANAGFVSWAPGQPDDYYEGEDCAQILSIDGGWNPGLWSDVSCSHRIYALCEKGDPYTFIYYLHVKISDFDVPKI